MSGALPGPPAEAVRRAVALALAEDLGALGDLTAALVPAGALARGALVARAAGVLAGRACAEEAFAAVDRSVVTRWGLDDGAELGAGTVLAEVEGPLRSVLTAERTALNFLCHLSGIATLTRRFADAAAAGDPRCRVLDTRKTTPGLRALEKAAVRAGGGANHRGSLSEAVLVKDNHLAGTSIAGAVARARALWPGRTVEVECDRLEQVHEALAAGTSIVMLDNMGPEEVAACVAVVRGVDPERRAVLVEVSGGVTLETAPAFAAAGADLVSVGALTHSAPALDIGLDLEEG
ncbi:MAG: carboxylating nicotinate-nucleotide diphosphorylase [Acidobacteriota bacterium]|nr:carboxylating nicotinate-nucleotide diphosphorylase [Acidobacteriota bacterium]